MHAPTDTIAALATARGLAALAVVRVSGPDALRIVDACTSGAPLAEADSHTAHFRRFRGVDGETLDEVVVTVFRAPRSATGEDVVEISCHGGDIASQLVLRTLIDRGARLAEPGEFTRRAFLNGKLDLAQAEAVADLIHASSAQAHRVSLAHLEGRYSEAVAALRRQLLHTAAMVELELDFAEEDVEFADKDELRRLLDDADALLTELLGSYRLGQLIRDGVRVVIGGRPNAGKSTLLNALLGTDRAIVSDVPGTTRDEIEAETEIDGLRFRFVDTAGLRDTSDAIEAEGVRRTHRSIRTADGLVYVYDLSVGLDPEERDFLRALAASHPELSIVLVGNKADLADMVPSNPFLTPFVAVSARRGLADRAETDALRRVLADAAYRGQRQAEGSRVVVNQRHRQHLQRAHEAVAAARAALDGDASGDTLALDLRLALHELGAITGEVTTEDILGEIFSRFCIGK